MRVFGVFLSLNGLLFILCEREKFYYFLYDDFLNVYKRCNLYSKEYLTYDQVLERREKIKEIIEALYEGQV